MGLLGTTVLVLLGKLWALQGAPGLSLSVRQLAPSQTVALGGSARLTCRVDLPAEAQQLRLEWVKAGETLCQRRVATASPSLGPCGPRTRLLWEPPGAFLLDLQGARPEDSGAYECVAILEVPLLDEARSNKSELEVLAGDSDTNSRGSQVTLLLTGGAALTVTSTLLGVWVWSRRQGHLDSGSPVYSNVLYRTRPNPKKAEARPAEKAQDVPREDQRVYVISLPRPPRPQKTLSPKPTPRHPNSAGGNCPCSGLSERPATKGVSVPPKPSGKPAPPQLPEDVTNLKK